MMVDFTIQPINDPPDHNIDTEQVAREDEPWFMDLTRSIWDVDNDKADLVLQTDCPYASFDGFVLNVLFPEPIGEYDLWFNISDGVNATLVRLHFTIIPAPTPPSEPTGFMAIPGDGEVELEWRAPSDDGDSSILGYRIFRGLSNVSLNEIGEVDANTITFTDANVTNGVTYYYAILSFNVIGDSPLSTLYITPFGLPGVPLDLVVEAGDGYVSISWTPPELDGGTPILGYNLLRGVRGDQVESYQVFGVGITTFNDTGLMNGQTFYYSVRARNNVGEGPSTAVLPATPSTVPNAPGDLIAQAGDGQVTITWLRSPDDGGSTILGYKIYRGPSEETMELLHTAASSTFKYEDEDVEVGTEYFYVVRAYNAVGESLPSIVVPATPGGPPGLPIQLAATAGNQEVHLSWSSPEDDGSFTITGYVILRGTSVASMRELVQLGDVYAYLDTSVTNGETYYYAIAAINEAGPGDYSEPVSATPFKPVTPPGKVMTLVADAKGAKVTLQWNAPREDGGSPVTGYLVYRGDSAGSMEVVATLGMVTTWTDEDVERGKTYYYSVAALNVAGEGEAFAAYEVKVPPQKKDSPGFEVVLVGLALLLVVPIARRRC
jgi:titin